MSLFLSHKMGALCTLQGSPEGHRKTHTIPSLVPVTPQVLRESSIVTTITAKSPLPCGAGDGSQGGWGW